MNLNVATESRHNPLNATLSGALANLPPPYLGLAVLMSRAYAGADLAPLGTELLARAAADPDDAHALMDLATVLQLRGHRELGLATQAQALQLQQRYHLPASGEGGTIRLLALMTPGDLAANTPLEFLVGNADVALDMLYVGADLPLPAALPDHDVLFIAVSESDETRPLLGELAHMVRTWPRPVLNDAACIMELARDAAHARLADAPGVAMPVTARVVRSTLERVVHGELAMTSVLADGDFPVVVRPVGSHAGRGLEKCDDAIAIARYLQAMPEREFYVARWVDYSSADGLFRKYRIVLIDGQPFVCHMGISTHWMVHYLNASMEECAEKRAEEAYVMAHFDDEFARRHAAALRAIHERLGLDYLGIDCGETTDGKLLIFEVESGPIVHAMDPVDIFPYKQPQMRKVFSAFRELLVRRMPA